jgi:hypothetical protein
MGPLFSTDDYKFYRLIAKFNAACDNACVRRCYSNRLEFGCGYVPAMEAEINRVCELAHTDEQVPWWNYLVD